ncbi:MAG: hypothetical protein IJH34_05990 [Romboutsia sp.]|nr:hypothetical protein [Romboutsia sp.]
MNNKKLIESLKRCTKKIQEAVSLDKWQKSAQKSLANRDYTKEKDLWMTPVNPSEKEMRRNLRNIDRYDHARKIAHARIDHFDTKKIKANDVKRALK